MASVLTATQSANARILEVLLQGPTSQEEMTKALHYACQEGLTDCVQCFLAAGVNPSVQDHSGNTPLHHALSQGHDDLVAVLCEARADVNGRGAGNNTPLHVAAKWGKDECLEILIRHGCNLNAVDSSQSTPLILAVKNKEYIAVGQLLGAGCDVNCKDGQGRTALHYASHTAVSVGRLIEAGANVNIQDNDGCTPLLMAATEGLEKVVTTLTQVPGCNPNLANHSARKSPLHILAPKGHVRSVDDLIGCGADVNLQDADDKTSLWYAVANGRTRVVALLLQCNSQVDTYQCPGASDVKTCPVRLAFEKGLVDILKLFITCGYDSQHMRECLVQAHNAAVFQNADHWLHFGQQVASLQQTCRKWIRHFLGSNLFKQCSQLPLPAKLIDFLLIKELNETIS